MPNNSSERHKLPFRFIILSGFPAEAARTLAWTLGTKIKRSASVDRDILLNEMQHKPEIHSLLASGADGSEIYLACLRQRLLALGTIGCAVAILTGDLPSDDLLRSMARDGLIRVVPGEGDEKEYIYVNPAIPHQSQAKQIAEANASFASQALAVA